MVELAILPVAFAHFVIPARWLPCGAGLPFALTVVTRLTIVIAFACNGATPRGSATNKKQGADRLTRWCTSSKLAESGHSVLSQAWGLTTAGTGQTLSPITSEEHEHNWNHNKKLDKRRLCQRVTELTLFGGGDAEGLHQAFLANPQ
jgi:hypothetical protein